MIVRTAPTVVAVVAVTFLAACGGSAKTIETIRLEEGDYEIISKDETLNRARNGRIERYFYGLVAGEPESMASAYCEPGDLDFASVVEKHLSLPVEQQLQSGTLRSASADSANPVGLSFELMGTRATMWIAFDDADDDRLICIESVRVDDPDLAPFITAD